MLSAMGYWKYNRLDVMSDSAGWSSADSITDVVNRNTSSRNDRNENLTQLESILNN
jgi:hypothetical protein